jgi:hypothetical protein
MEVSKIPPLDSTGFNPLHKDVARTKMKLDYEMIARIYEKMGNVGKMAEYQKKIDELGN